jgi:hypothetical protein
MRRHLLVCCLAVLSLGGGGRTALVRMPPGDGLPPRSPRRRSPASAVGLCDRTGQRSARLSRRFLVRGSLVLGGFLVAAPALAYTAPPVTSFAKPTGDGRHVLVMLHTGPGGRGTDLNARYARSGLYPADDPTTPRWVCNWTSARERGVFASDDGVYAVRVPDGDPGLRRWLLQSEALIPARAANWDEATAMFIYKNGRLERTLSLKDVFDTRRFTDRDCYQGPVVTIESFRDAAGRVTLATEAGGTTLTATVDFRTGVTNNRSGSVVPALDGVAFCPSTGEPPSGRSWWWPVLAGLTVVGAGTAVFVVLAALLARRP